MYGVNLWYTEKYCNVGESKTYTGCYTAIYKRKCKNPLKMLHLLSSWSHRYSRIRNSSSQEVNSIEKLFKFSNLSYHSKAVLPTVVAQNDIRAVKESRKVLEQCKNSIYEITASVVPADV